jgi:deoxyxylulose-5-phosphate synthase
MASAGIRAARKMRCWQDSPLQTGETMAIEGDAATVPLSAGLRLDGLNHIAELRAKVFGLNIDSWSLIY